MNTLLYQRMMEKQNEDDPIDIAGPIARGAAARNALNVNETFPERKKNLEQQNTLNDYKIQEEKSASQIKGLAMIGMKADMLNKKYDSHIKAGRKPEEAKAAVQPEYEKLIPEAAAVGKDGSPDFNREENGVFVDELAKYLKTKVSGKFKQVNFDQGAYAFDEETGDVKPLVEPNTKKPLKNSTAGKGGTKAREIQLTEYAISKGLIEDTPEAASLFLNNALRGGKEMSLTSLTRFFVSQGDSIESATEKAQELIDASAQSQTKDSPAKTVKGGNWMDSLKFGGGWGAKSDAAPAPETASLSPAVPTGAKQAPDGKWYVPDPKRPGKYLQVQSR